MKEIILNAITRDQQGSSASKRLRKQGLIPSIIYGSGAASEAISLDHNLLYYALKNEDFHTSILTIQINGKKEKALLRNVSMHPFKQQILHLDFQRINEREEVSLNVPLHFINEDLSPAIKQQGAHITHVLTEVEVRALATDLPHFIEVDLKKISAGQTIHLSNLALPTGVSLVSLLRGDDAVVAIAAGISEAANSDSSLTGDTIAVADIPTVGDNGQKDKA